MHIFAVSMIDEKIKEHNKVDISKLSPYAQLGDTDIKLPIICRVNLGFIDTHTVTHISYCLS